MKNILKNSKGITLVALVTIAAILMILASITLYNGVTAVKSSHFSEFTAEMKVMQMQVNQLYEEYKNGNNEILELGQELSSTEQENTAFTGASVDEREGYRLFTQSTLEQLGIKDVEGEYLVNVAKRSVISYEGYEYDGQTYYTIEQLPDGLYNVEYSE